MFVNDHLYLPYELLANTKSLLVRNILVLMRILFQHPRIALVQRYPCGVVREPAGLTPSRFTIAKLLWATCSHTRHCHQAVGSGQGGDALRAGRYP